MQTIDHLLSIGVPKVQFSAVSTTEKHYLTQDAKMYLLDLTPMQVSDCVRGLLERKAQHPERIGPSARFIRGIGTYFQRPSQVVFPCFAGYLALDVYYDGSVFLCGNLPRVGNIKDHTLSSIWTGSEASQLRKNMVEGKCPNCYFSCKMEPSIAANYKYLPSFSIEKIFSSS
ncbi:MAG: SPASM domain-containing protein [Bdellovibrionota bacterium]